MMVGYTVVCAKTIIKINEEISILVLQCTLLKMN